MPNFLTCVEYEAIAAKLSFPANCGPEDVDNAVSAARKDKGRESHDQYTEQKTVFINLDR